MNDDLMLLIGPSGSGKSALVERLVRAGAVTVTPTVTTRPRRADETGIACGSANHRFVDDDTFDRLERYGAFLGVVRLPGLVHRYGLPRPAPSPTGAVPVVVARASFVAAVRAHRRHGPTYQVERPAVDVLRALCERRTSTREVVARLRHADAERRAGRALADRCFVNDGSLDGLVVAVIDALRADAVGRAPGVVAA